MSEVQSRPATTRGRGGSARSRGGFSGRGRPRGGHATNGDKCDTTTAAPIENDGEVGQLKKQYGDRVSTIKEMFPHWTDEDIVFALQETDGDLMTTVDRITEGTISQWGEVSKTKKDRSRSKVKDATIAESLNQTSRVSRGGRAGIDSGRGGRGRATDRGRDGRARGASAAHTNGSRNKENVETSMPTTDSNAWDTLGTSADASSWDTVGKTAKSAEEPPTGWGSTTADWGSTTAEWGYTAADAASATAAVAANVTSSIIPDGVKKSWASIFTKPTLPQAPKAHELPAKSADHTKLEGFSELPTIEPEASILEPAPVKADVPAPTESTLEQPEINITPSKDDLTEDNLEQIPDTSNPAPTATAASTAASSWDPRNASTTGTPYSLQHGQPQAIRPSASGFQASALKATGAPGRTSSYQRRILDQEEAVRMPGNRELDRAAVQFGAFNLNGSGEEDVDGEREEPETRAQPPQHSPVAPRAALPPAQHQVTAAESFPTPKQSAGLPAASHPTSAPGLPSPQALPGAQSSSQHGPQGTTPFSQYGRYGQGVQEPSSLPQKPYDAFNQQAASAQSPFEGYPSQQTPAQPQHQSGTLSSGPDQFSSYYTSDPQQRNAYNSYYQQQYGLQQGIQGQQDGSAPQRSFSGYNGPQADGGSQFSQSAAQQGPTRYATAGAEGSGNNTPNPTSQAQQQGTNHGQGAQPHQSGHPQQPQAGNYPYGHPYYSSPYYAAYMNQYQQYGGGNYGAGPYGAKGGLHQPYQGYGMSPSGAPYEHASSPAAAGFGGSSGHGRDSALGGGLGDYGRAGSAQSAQTPQGLGGSGAFGGSHDPFARGSYPGQNQQHYNTSQGAQAGTGDELKPFGDSKPGNGPSPSLSQAGRPGSATNAAPGSALPPPQSQQGYGGYPAHLPQQLHNTQASSYGGLGGAGGHQAAGQGHQGSQYGGYQGFGGYNYGNNQQQRGGWGGNYGGH